MYGDKEIDFEFTSSAGYKAKKNYPEIEKIRSFCAKSDKKPLFYAEWRYFYLVLLMGW